LCKAHDISISKMILIPLVQDDPDIFRPK